jgi:NAD(P)-dependent dehydrogenase (short-subunit alcohol dehydrogenase family)
MGTIYLTQRLLPLLEAGAPSRVVVLSSELASYSPALPLDDLGGEKLRSSTMTEYNVSKLCDALYALEFSRRYGSRGVIAASTHPGVVATELTGKAQSSCFASSFLSCGSMMACTPRVGAISSLYAATVPGLKGTRHSSTGARCELPPPACATQFDAALLRLRADAPQAARALGQTMRTSASPTRGSQATAATRPRTRRQCSMPRSSSSRPRAVKCSPVLRCRRRWAAG